MRVDRDDLAARGILVGLEPEDGPVVVNKRVLGLELTNQVDRFGVRLFERTVEDAKFVVRPFLDDEDQVGTVIRDQRIGTPLFVLGIFPYKTVVGLRAAEAVIKNLLIIIRLSSHHPAWARENGCRKSPGYRATIVRRKT